MSVGLELITSILENGSSTTFRLLEERELVDDEEKSTYRFVDKHYRRYGELPTIETVEDQLAVRLPETPEHIDYYLDQVHNRTVYNGVREEFADLRTSLQDMDVDGMLRTANEIRKVCVPRSGQSTELLTLAQVMDDVRDNYNYAYRKSGETGIPTGHSYLDEQTGGYQNGDMVTWVARPAMGKSYLLIHGARTALMRGKSVLFVSMEMPLSAIGMRFAAIQAGIDPDAVRKGKLCYFARRRFDDALVTLGEAHNFHLFAGNFNKSTADVDILIHELGPDLVCVDGMYLMRPADMKNNMGRFERAAYVTDDIKRMTITNNRPVVVTTQFGRDAKGKGSKGSMETIGYTDAISTHSSIIVAIKPGKEVIREVKDVDAEGVTYTRATQKIYPFRHMELMKGREGEQGEWGMHFSFSPLSFDEVPVDIATGKQSERRERPNLDYME